MCAQPITRPSRRAVVGAAAVLTLTACSGGSGSEGSGGSAGGGSSTLTLATAVDINSFAPADSRDAHYVQFYQPVYDSLLQLDPQGEYQPMLATAWEYDDTSTVLHLELRDGVTFTDGAAFDGEAVKANLLAVRDGTGTSSAAFAGITDVVVGSPTSVDVHLAAPDPGLVRQLALPGGMMASPASLGTDQLKTVPVGSGPYVYDEGSSTQGSQYTFTRNPDHWNADAFPYDTIVLKPITDATARLNAIRSGQVDGGTGDALNAAQAEAAGLTVTQSPGPGFQGLFLFDREGRISAPLGDVRVRQALNHAVDPDAILQTLYDGAGTVTGQVFNPKSAVWDDGLNGAYPYDPDKARDLLSQAGYGDGFDLDIPEPVYANLSPLLGQQLAAVGVTVNFVPVPQATVNDEYLSGKYPVVWYQLQSSDPWQGVNFWGSTAAPWNPLHVEDPRITAQIAVVQAARGDEQTDAYQELAQLYIDEAWFVPAYFPDAVYFSNADVSVEPQALQIVPSIYNYRPAS